MRSPFLAWLALAAVLLATRLAHREILWVEEAYPAAAAIQMAQARALYSDVLFDKPPLSAAVYRLWNGRPGWPLRVAGALYVLLCAALAFAAARRWWPQPAGGAAGGTEAPAAALLVAFYLTFGIPASVMALAPDLLSVAPALALAWALAAGRSTLAGSILGFTIAGLNGKALVLVPLAFWFGGRSRIASAALGLAGGAAIALGPLAWLSGVSLDPRLMWTQVWEWGSAYSRDTPVQAPLREALVRISAWCGFQATAVIAAGWFWSREPRTRPARFFALWTALALAMVCLGWRFAPRYHLTLIAPLALAAARGLALMPARARYAALALLLIPAARFGPRYASLLASDPMPASWPDIAMNRSSAAASQMILGAAQPGDTILVWGYRPDILVYTRLALGTPFLDSQPLTGVLADRHLTQSRATFPALASANRQRLAALSPTWVVDGLGPYNPALAITRYPDLTAWFARYQLHGETPGVRIYRLARRP